MTLSQIDNAVKLYADARADLGDIVRELNEQIDALKRARMAAIKQAVARAAERKAALRAGIEESPDLFQKPRTLTIRGIKIGFTKAKGGIEFEDAEQVIALIRKKLGDKADVLIRVKESPNKAALAELSVAELKSIGCTVTDSGDVVVISPADSDVEKIVDALLEEKEAA